MKAILTDITKCIGCRECVIGCKRKHGLDQEYPRRWVIHDGLSAHNWTSVLQVKGGYVRKFCRHCLQPACVSVCPVAALKKSETGAVIYDSTRCLGCRYCMMSCPFGIPRYHWESRVPTVRKCVMCYQSIDQGEQPACTSACPVQATIFGDRDQLLVTAYTRIASKPELYINRVWGEKEVGGTCVFYISHIDLGFLYSGKQLGTEALPELTAPAMEAVPYTFVGMGLFLVGSHWFIKRRMKIEREKDKKGGENE